MKKVKKIMSALLVMSMVLTIVTMSASAVAPAPDSNNEAVSLTVTPAEQVNLAADRSWDLIPLKITDGYN